MCLQIYYFNETKFVHIHCWDKSFSDLNSTVNGKPIRQFSQHKDLGVIFTSILDWTDHYRTITMKAYQMLGLIRCTFKINSIEAKKQLDISLIRSQLMHCSRVWRPQLIKDIRTYSGTCPTKSYQIRSERLHIFLQIKTTTTKRITTNVYLRTK